MRATTAAVMIVAAALCWPLPVSSQAPSSSKITGTLGTIESVPNQPGTRCGNHLQIAVTTDDGKAVVLRINDPKVRISHLDGFKGKTVEIDLLGDNAVMGIRLADKAAATAALENLSTRQLC